MRRRWWDLRAQADDGAVGGGGGGGAVAPAAAREFLTAFAPSPDILKDMPDDQVMAWHGGVSKQLTAAQQKAIESYDWRGAIAGDNPDAKKTLERFASPKALYESYDQFRTKLSKGELRAVSEFPAKGTDEEKAAWRQQNGVPADGKYEIQLPDGIVPGDDDKPVMEAFQKHAFERNLPASAVNEVMGWYFTERVARQERAREEFEAAKRDTAAELGAEYGPEYKSNLNRVQGLLDATIPSGEDGAALKQLINNAVATNPAFARHYVQMALAMNESGTLVPGGQESNEKSIADGIREIEAFMRKDRPAYDRDEAKRTRYRELLGAYQKLTGKEWGRE